MMQAQTFLRRVRRKRHIYWMMLPVLLYFVVFCFYPLLLGLIQSFQKERMFGPAVYHGVANYREVIRDYAFWQSFANSLTIGLGGMLVGTPVAVLFSVAVNETRSKLAVGTLRIVSYLPSLFSWTVVGGMWLSILSYDGLLNSLCSALGCTRQVFMSNAALAQPIMILTGVWKGVGYNMVLLLAAIVSIDSQLYEAACIDGASRMRQIRSIMLPQIVPTIKIMLVLGATGLLRNFDQVFIMSNASILDKVRTLMLYIYNYGITQFKIGRATAAATIVLLATIVLTTAVRKIARYDQNYQ